ncbi:MAG: hypothetical protein R2705_22855 [Ilumatobacteraceae bacterium]
MLAIGAAAGGVFTAAFGRDAAFVAKRGQLRPRRARRVDDPAPDAARSRPARRSARRMQPWPTWAKRSGAPSRIR